MIKDKILIFALGITIGFPLGVLTVKYLVLPDPGNEVLLHAQMVWPCLKCGSSDHKIRYCMEKCNGPSLFVQRGVVCVSSEVVWTYPHLHRKCASCSYEGEIMECVDSTKLGGM